MDGTKNEATLPLKIQSSPYRISRTEFEDKKVIQEIFIKDILLLFQSITP